MFFKKVQKQIEEKNMIAENDRIILGLSGGADSVCLLLLLSKLREVLRFSLEAIHVEHGIRGEESKEDARFAEALCKQLQVSYQMMSVDVPAYAAQMGLGFEEAARILRYEIFEQVAEGKNAKIALAHHMEDNAETILFQMVRGSSLTGLCGISPVRQGHSGVTYIRPLLSVRRSEIEGYLQMQKQPYRTDSTNQELEYSRNYLRNVVLPELTQINQQAIAHINETATQLSELRDFLDEQVELHWKNVAHIDEDVVLDLTTLKPLHLVLQKEIIYRAIGIMAGGKKDISSVHVEQVLDLIDNQSGKEVTLPNGLIAVKENTTIRLLVQRSTGNKIEENAAYQVGEEEVNSLLENGQTLCIALGKAKKKVRISIVAKEPFMSLIPQKTYTKWFDYDKMKHGFCIRTRQSGDYLICDAAGHKKKLKQYLIDEKIPVTKRDEVLIFAQDHRVLWVVGGRISEDVKITEDTRVIMEITIEEEA